MYSKHAVLLTALFLVIAGCATTNEYRPVIALNDAARIADPDKKFLAFYIPAYSPSDAATTELSKDLLGAAKTKANLAVVGPDSALTARILRAALLSVSKGSLEGVTILYVGENDGIEELKSASLNAGANFRATKYSGK